MTCAKALSAAAAFTCRAAVGAIERRRVGIATGGLVLLLASASVLVARRARGESDPQEEAAAEPDSISEAPASVVSGPADLVTSVHGEFGAYTDSDAVRVVTPVLSGSVRSISDGWAVNTSYLVDVVSAASVDIVSTASRRWTETRHAITVEGDYKPSGIDLGVGAAASREPDYTSLAAGANASVTSANKMITPSIGYRYAHDTAGRTGTPFSVFSREVDRHTVSAGAEFIVDAGTLVWVGADAVFEFGDQANPYRFLPIFAPAVAARIPPGAGLALVNETRLPGRMEESLPGHRARLALSTRAAHRVGGVTMTVHERLYADDWGLAATTTDFRLVLDVTRAISVSVHDRLHFQSRVSFWERAYASSFQGDGTLDVPKFRTGDRELGPLSSASLGAGIRCALLGRPAWTLGFQGDAMITHFRDALYVLNRRAFIGVVDLEVEF